MTADIVPRISLRDFDARREDIKAEMMEAATNSGFFVLVDHPIPPSHIDRAFDLSASFFDLPHEVKAKTPWNGKNMGWEFKSQIRPSTGYADPKESIQLGLGKGPDMTASWPSEEDLPGFKAGAQAFQKEVQELSVKLMELLAEGVGLPTDTFTAGTVCPEDSDKEMSMSTLRMLKYHALEDGVDMGANYFRAGAHADFDVLTLLFAAQAGLELCPGRKISTEFGYGDQWYPIACNKYEICCNLGDQLMRWSDDKLKSTFHRVTCPRPGVDAYLGDRYSIGFFNQARKDAIIQGPLKHYEPITGAEFIAQAMKRNYDAALKAAKLQTYDISEANKDAIVSGTGLEKSRAVAAEA